MFGIWSIKGIKEWIPPNFYHSINPPARGLMSVRKPQWDNQGWKIIFGGLVGRLVGWLVGFVGRLIKFSIECGVRYNMYYIHQTSKTQNSTVNTAI